MKTLAFATAAVGLVLTATPALAETIENRSKEISVAGLDLESADGQRMLDQRIERAARAVCGVDEPQTATRIRSSKAYACVAKARANAKQQVAAFIEDQRRGG